MCVCVYVNILSIIRYHCIILPLNFYKYIVENNNNNNNNNK